MTSLTEQQKNDIYMMGRIGFSFKEVALNFGFNIEEVAQQFQSENGEIFEQWTRGYLSAQAEIRKTVLDAALNSSQPAILQMLKYYATTEQNNLEAFDYETRKNQHRESPSDGL